MKLKKRDELLNDIIHQGKKNPTGWMASFGKNNHHLSDDYYLLHPNIGLFYMKEYQKNPFQQFGIGGKIARKIDGDVTEELRKQAHNFGIIQGDIRKITKNIQRGISPKEIIQGMYEGKDKGMSLPVKGKATNSIESMKKVKEQGKDNQKKINHHFKKMAKEDGLYASYD